MKIYFIRVISIIVLIIAFVNIFRFSSQSGDKSEDLSESITRRIIVIFNKNISDSEIEERVKAFDPIIRKLAHFCSYAIVGMAACCFVVTFNMKWKYRILISISAGFLYAITDEIHQGFIPGRSPQVTDIMIDTLGATTGAFLIWIIIQAFTKIKKNKKM